MANPPFGGGANMEQADTRIEILLVDSGADEWPALTEALALEDPQGRRFHIAQVHGAEQALEALVDCPFDLVLVAAQVGGRSGIEVAREVLLSGCAAPAVLITRRGDALLQRQALAAGVADYVERGRYTTDLFERIIRHTRDFNELLALLRQTEDCYREAVGRSASAEWTWELETRRIMFSPSFKAQLGYSHSGLPDVSDAWFSRMLPADAQRFKQALREVLQGERPRIDLEFRVQHRDGNWLWVRVEADLEVGGDAGPCLKGVQTDITAERLANMRLEYAANHDPLTGLLRRPVFVERLKARLLERPAADLAGALCVCDIDGLKGVNHAHGRQAGDEGLLWLAGAIEDRVGQQGLAARLTGDKFACVLGHTSLGEAVAAVQQMRAELTAEIFANDRGEEFRLSATFAVGMRAPGEDAQAWLRRVDLCLAEAQRHGMPVAALESNDVPRSLTDTQRMQRPSSRPRKR